MGAMLAGAVNLNVTGKQVTGPLKGFGQLWQKTYSVRLTASDIAPEDLITVWKAEFPNLWPDGNRFFGTVGQIEPGDVALLNISGPGGATISTGILVIFADAESFSFMTPQGHIFAGMITFSAHEDDGVTVAQIQALVRASDPLYEIGCRVASPMSRKIPSGTAPCAPWPPALASPASCSSAPPWSTRACSGPRWAPSGTMPRCARRSTRRSIV